MCLHAHLDTNLRYAHQGGGDDLPLQGTYGLAKVSPKPAPNGIEDYESMTKEELIDALIMARINEARLKKGYMVEGVGAEKKVIRFVKKNTK